MQRYILERSLSTLLTLVLVSVVSFIVIQLPPGDYVDYYMADLRAQGLEVDEMTMANLERQYGLDRPIYVQYYKWISGIILRGDFGRSLRWKLPVSELIWERLGLTVLLTLTTLVFVWIVSFIIGVYSATHQYSLGDSAATFLGFIGLATPNFLLALVLMWISYEYFGWNVGGLFSAEYADAAWSIPKFVDMLKHIWIAVVVIGTAGTAGLIRLLRANLLDELYKPYVTTARSKGISEQKLLYKYPLRVAIIPFISTVGWTLPTLISGSAITSVVLRLPTTGPLLLEALKSQDMYLAASFILMLGFLTVLGTFVSDILLTVVDPRIKYDTREN